MKFLCPSCKAKYLLADEKVVGRSVRMKCRKCGHMIHISDPSLTPHPDAAAHEAEIVSATVEPPPSSAAVHRLTMPAPPVEADEDETTAIVQPKAVAAAMAAALRGSGAPKPADDGWFVAINGVPVGPVKSSELRSKAATGAITLESLAWREGCEEWRPLRTFPELAALVEQVQSEALAAAERITQARTEQQVAAAERAAEAAMRARQAAATRVSELALSQAIAKSEAAQHKAEAIAARSEPAPKVEARKVEVAPKVEAPKVEAPKVEAAPSAGGEKSAPRPPPRAAGSPSPPSTRSPSPPSTRSPSPPSTRSPSPPSTRSLKVPVEPAVAAAQRSPIASAAPVQAAAAPEVVAPAAASAEVSVFPAAPAKSSPAAAVPAPHPEPIREATPRPAPAVSPVAAPGSAPKAAPPPPQPPPKPIVATPAATAPAAVPLPVFTAQDLFPAVTPSAAPAPVQESSAVASAAAFAAASSIPDPFGPSATLGGSAAPSGVRIEVEYDGALVRPPSNAKRFAGYAAMLLVGLGIGFVVFFILLRPEAPAPAAAQPAAAAKEPESELPSVPPPQAAPSAAPEASAAKDEARSRARVGSPRAPKPETEGESKLTGDLKNLGAPAAPVEGPRSESTGAAAPPPATELGQGQVQATVARYTGGVKRSCWQPALDTRDKDAPMSARVNVTLTVSPGGSVDSVSTSGDPRGYRGLSSCIANKVRGWQFPASSSSTTLNVPFVFAAQ